MATIKTRHADYQKIKGNLGFGKRMSLNSIAGFATANSAALSQYIHDNQQYLTDTEKQALETALAHMRHAYRFIRLVSNK